MSYLLAPFIWGVLEATLLFMVPDVAISYVTLKLGLRKGVLAALVASFGAALGGLIMYRWGSADLAQALAIIERLPAISKGMVENVDAQMHGDYPYWSMLTGSLTGTPYKIYASFAASASIHPLALFLITPLVRLPRFLLVVMLTGLAARVAGRFVPDERCRLFVLVAFWIIFYIGYWSLMPG